MNWLESILNKNEKLAVGLISGTSMDGIDASLVKISGHGSNTQIEIIDFICEQYSPQLKSNLENLATGFSLEKLSSLNFMIGKEFADAASMIIKKNGFDNKEIDFIGSHGQTVFHNPPSLNNEISSTLQIGEIDVICEETGITTIGDFRTKDLASGGEGAPFIPYLDFVLFNKLNKSIVAQNIGGIANCSLINSDWNDLIAFDSGPGNSLMDSVVFLTTKGERRFDNGGELASRGSINEKLLEKLLKIPYLKLPLPKSTGKELFGFSMAEELLDFSKKEGINLNDLLCTLVEFTCETIVSSYERFIFPVHKVEE
ncbi:MAG: anhydro-N-acetylmuramic acid kinase, partial [Thermodesulfobacteriota bacterium]